MALCGYQRDALRAAIDAAARARIAQQNGARINDMCGGCGCRRDEFTPGCKPCTRRRRDRTGRDVTGPLTPREEAVLVAIADGLLATEIAADLNLSSKTVKGYTQGVLRKLCARNRAHAVALAYHEGILTPKASVAVRDP